MTSNLRLRTLIDHIDVVVPVDAAELRRRPRTKQYDAGGHATFVRFPAFTSEASK